MRRSARLWLEDIVSNGQDVLEFIEGKSLEDYESDKALRAMVERKLFAVGEAVARLRDGFPETYRRLTDSPEIIGFRNILAHGYFALEHHRVFDIALNSVPLLVSEASELLTHEN